MVECESNKKIQTKKAENSAQDQRERCLACITKVVEFVFDIFGVFVMSGGLLMYIPVNTYFKGSMISMCTVDYEVNTYFKRSLKLTGCMKLQWKPVNVNTSGLR